METLMIPAVRRSLSEKSTLLSELDCLSQEALKNIRSLYRQTRVVYETEKISVEALLSLMLDYCHKLMQRLEKEEIELYPVARQLLSSDDWFSIAVASMQIEMKPLNRLGRFQPSTS